MALNISGMRFSNGTAFNVTARISTPSWNGTYNLYTLGIVPAGHVGHFAFSTVPELQPGITLQARVETNLGGSIESSTHYTCDFNAPICAFFKIEGTGDAPILVFNGAGPDTQL
ncbi:hypothetical protein GYMLUDRAFT_255416 [Collybiopsis luxurians FD-317 M1]|nr:hypothetical protein GYMLUDRAFT_255416 [Collybiopsis luxurians FD-317 M1]